MRDDAAAFWGAGPAPALVLSAGGMFGAWQAGAWTVLSRTFRPSAVVGSSVGALNGWAIAGGIDPEELAQRWLDPAMRGLMRPRFPWVPWNGVFAPRGLEELVRELFASFKPRVPFATTLAEVPRLRTRLVRGEEMTWHHLMAACAVPFGFPPIRIDGKYYVDGGLLGALPLWACPRMGTERAVALDSLPRMPSAVVRGFVRMARAAAPRYPAERPAEVLRLAPEPPLGSVREAVVWDRERVRGWIERGARDAKLLVPGGPSVSHTVFD
ncbi:MAG TPA: patatin-like phospholipase family protein [Bryobacteraceae bacterium]|nr:patatin-like phospholipase family protein [Bryobacteraceae bacterium]